MFPAATVAYRAHKALGLYLHDMCLAEQRPRQQFPSFFPEVFVLDVGEQLERRIGVLGKPDLHGFQIERHWPLEKEKRRRPFDRRASRLSSVERFEHQVTRIRDSLQRVDRRIGDAAAGKLRQPGPADLCCFLNGRPTPAASLQLLAYGGDRRVFHRRLFVQNFAQSSRNTLRKASPRLVNVKKTIVQTVARNFKLAYDASEFRSHRALARAAHVSSNTVRNIMEPEGRDPGRRGDAGPTLEVLDKVAEALGYRLWQLLHENFEPKNAPTRVLTKNQAHWYGKFEKLYQEHPPDQE